MIELVSTFGENWNKISKELNYQLQLYNVVIIGNYQ